jgi:hypothetical protein
MLITLDPLEAVTDPAQTTHQHFPTVVNSDHIALYDENSATLSDGTGIRLSPDRFQQIYKIMRGNAIPLQTGYITAQLRDEPGEPIDLKEVYVLPEHIQL